MWLSEAQKYLASGVLGGVLGSGVTYGLNVPRERRRTRDAYRAPQRQAIGEILTATHALMLRELEMRTRMNEVADKIEQLLQLDDNQVDPATVEQLKATMSAMGETLRAAMASLGTASLEVDRAFAIGTLTIVDPPCWEAMGAAAVEFHRIRLVMQAGAATQLQTVEEIRRYTQLVAENAAQFNLSVQALVHAGQDRVSPTETVVNPWRRRGARRRLSEHYKRRIAGDTPDDTPQPHY